MGSLLQQKIHEHLSGKCKELQFLIKLIHLNLDECDPSGLVKKVNLLSSKVKRIENFITNLKVSLLKSYYNFVLQQQKSGKQVVGETERINQLESFDVDITGSLAEFIIQLKSFLSGSQKTDYFVKEELQMMDKILMKNTEMIQNSLVILNAITNSLEFHEFVELLIAIVREKDLPGLMQLICSQVLYNDFLYKEFQVVFEDYIAEIIKNVLKLFYEDSILGWENIYKTVMSLVEISNLNLVDKSQKNGYSKRRSSLPLKMQEDPDEYKGAQVTAAKTEENLGLGSSTSFLDSKSDSVIAIQDLILSLCSLLQELITTYSNNNCLEVIMNATILESMISNTAQKFYRQLDFNSIRTETISSKSKELGQMWIAFKPIIQECKEVFNTAYKSVLVNPDCCNKQVLNRTCIDFLDSVLNLYHLSQHLNVKADSISEESMTATKTQESKPSENQLPDIIDETFEVLPEMKSHSLKKKNEFRTPLRGHRHSNSTSNAVVESKSYLLKNLFNSSTKSHSFLKRSVNPSPDNNQITRRLSIHHSISDIVKSIENDETDLLYEEISKNKRNDLHVPSEFVCNSERILKGGKLEKLIERISWFQETDKNLTSDFIFCFHLFCSSDHLFDSLENRYTLRYDINLTPTQQQYFSEQVIARIKNKVLQILKKWIEIHPNDFSSKKGIGNKTRQFISKHLDLQMKEAFLRLLPEEDLPVAVKHMSLNHEESFSFTSNPFLIDAPPPLIPKSLETIGLFTIEPLELARQLSLLDFNLFSKIPLTEFLSKETPNISNLIQRFNFVTQWVITEILYCKNIKERAKAIKQFIKTGQKAFELCNYNSLNAILAGLQSASVHRLRKTWQLVSKKRLIVLEELTKLMASDDNYKSLREAWESVKPPSIPWIGLYQRDITFLMDAHPNYLKEHSEYINLSKLKLLAPMLKQIYETQKEGYRFHNVITVQKYLQNDRGLLKTENDQFKVSLMLEPKEF